MRGLRILLSMILLAGVATAQTTLNAGGATFPYPIYSKWFSEYHKAHPEVSINYQSQGSGFGIQQLTAQTIDFGASDMPMTDQQLAAAKRPIYQFPTVLGAVVPAYNLPGVSDLQFSGKTLADIYLGKVSNWNDKEIAADNPGKKLPDKQIVVVHRSEGSGTTFIFTDYLCKVSPEWNSGPGKNTSVRWPVGLGAKGNEAVAGMIRQMDGALGYVELIYALQNNISFGAVKNAAGQWVKGSLESTTAAAAGVKNMPGDFRVSITNAPGAGSYPIASFTWMLVPAQWNDQNKKKIMVDFLNWMLDSGQTMTSALKYAPLPKEVTDKERAKIKEIR